MKQLLRLILKQMNSFRTPYEQNLQTALLLQLLTGSTQSWTVTSRCRFYAYFAVRTPGSPQNDSSWSTESLHDCSHTILDLNNNRENLQMDCSSCTINAIGYELYDICQAAAKSMTCIYVQQQYNYVLCHYSCIKQQKQAHTLDTLLVELAFIYYQ